MKTLSIIAASHSFHDNNGDRASPPSASSLSGTMIIVTQEAERQRQKGHVHGNGTYVPVGRKLLVKNRDQFDICNGNEKEMLKENCAKWRLWNAPWVRVMATIKMIAPSSGLSINTHAFTWLKKKKSTANTSRAWPTLPRSSQVISEWHRIHHQHRDHHFVVTPTALKGVFANGLVPHADDRSDWLTDLHIF